MQFRGLSKCFDGLLHLAAVLEQKAQAVLRVGVIWLQCNTGSELADRRIRVSLALQNLPKIIVSAWVRGIQLYCSLQVLRGFFDGFFLVTQNAQMKMRLSEIRLQPQRLRKLRFRALSVRLLYQH